MATKQKILIVDDDTNIAELISLYLTKECYETKTSVTDSLGNTYTNCILLDCGHYGGNVIYNINNRIFSNYSYIL